MSWDRSKAAPALAEAIAAANPAVSVFDKPPLTLNPPAIVVGRQTEVAFATSAFGVDEATLPVFCVGPADGDDIVAGLITAARDAIDVDPTLGGIVQRCDPVAERNWRGINVAGTELLQAELSLLIRM